MMTASGAAMMMLRPNSLSTMAVKAPSVSSSPCEKFVRPVVPKIRLRPTAPRAIRMPKQESVDDQLGDLAELPPPEPSPPVSPASRPSPPVVSLNRTFFCPLRTRT